MENDKHYDTPFSPSFDPELWTRFDSMFPISLPVYLYLLILVDHVGPACANQNNESMLRFAIF